MLRLTTAGESHGYGIIALIHNLPSGIPVTKEIIEEELKLRREGYGRGARMNVEEDKVEIISGLFKGKTSGSPLTILIKNTEHDKWSNYLNGTLDIPELDRIVARPGHADYAGCLKYGFDNLRPVIERASARHTAAYVAAGAVFKQALKFFGVSIGSILCTAGKINFSLPEKLTSELLEYVRNSKNHIYRNEEEEKLLNEVKKAKELGTTLGGSLMFFAFGVVPGIGSYADYEMRLDSKLASLLMAIPSVKAVELGRGIDSSKSYGSEVLDEFDIDKDGNVLRKSNFSGGIEGGISNGEVIYGRLFFKPIPTQANPLDGLNIKKIEVEKAFYERSDVFAGKAIGIIAESLLAYALLQGYLEKFGHDNITDVLEAYNNYRKRIRWEPRYELRL